MQLPEALSTTDLGLSVFDLPVGISTPSVVVDLDRLGANLARMQDQLDRAGVGLRPHLKTAKSLEVARRAVDLGAVGITVATAGEAEVFAAGGIESILVAYPVLATGPLGPRVRDLHEACRLRVGIDSTDGAASLAAAVRGADRPLEVLVEVDCGEHRTGVPPDRAGDLAGAAVDMGLRVVGAFTHGGHSYAGPDAVAPAARDEVHALAVARDAMVATGTEPEVLSAGSTPTALLSAMAPVTEERPGTYVYGDRQQANLGAVDPAHLALVVAATVVSTSAPGRAVVDAGAKVLAKDRPAWLAGHGVIPALPGAVITSVHDHHGTVLLPPGADAPVVGTVVAVVPNHVCPVVNLVDHVTVVRRGRVVDTWSVDTRGRF